MDVNLNDHGELSVFNFQGTVIRNIKKKVWQRQTQNILWASPLTFTEVKFQRRREGGHEATHTCTNFSKYIVGFAPSHLHISGTEICKYKRQFRKTKPAGCLFLAFNLLVGLFDN